MLIVANWKAYVEDLKKAGKLVAAGKRLARTTKHDIVLAPPAPLLSVFAAKNRSRLAFAAQDVSMTTGGAVTGESTASAFHAGGAAYAIIGHSERRSMGESDTDIAEKLARALAHELIPILCVGERERDGEGRYLSYVREQITTALTPLTPKERAQVVLAYEPVWAIGKGAAFAINQSDLTEMVLYIRKVLAELLPGKSSGQSRVLYGGSVEPADVRDLAGASGVNGFLVGHASVDPAAFTELVRQLA